MKTILFDSLNEEGARKLAGCKIVDESGQPVGAVDGVWVDSTSHRVEFFGVKSRSFSGKVHVIPARDAQFIEDQRLIRLQYPAAYVNKAPSFFPGDDLALAQKEEINEYGSRSKEPQRVNAIEDVRPEEALRESGRSEPIQHAGETRKDLEKQEQHLFDQDGFVTDSVPEVDVSRELNRSQKEAKLRNSEDRIKDGHLD